MVKTKCRRCKRLKVYIEGHGFLCMQCDKELFMKAMDASRNTRTDSNLD